MPLFRQTETVFLELDRVERWDDEERERDRDREINALEMGLCKRDRE